MNTELNFENTAEIGDVVRSWDFKPMEDRGDCFIEGIVVGKDDMMFEIVVQKRVFDGDVVDVTPGEAVRTAFKVLFMEWAGRITKLEVA